MAENVVGTDSDIDFGMPLPDWREQSTNDDFDPDDELLPETPEDVIFILGFDPLEIDK